MGTFIAILIAFAVGVATGLYRGKQARRELEQELSFEQSFNGGRKPKLTEASVRKRVEEGGPVPSDPDMGDFLDDAQDEEPAYELDKRIKNEDAQQLHLMIRKLGPTAWISKTTANKELGWGFNRYKAALEYLQRNRYVKKLDAKKNRGVQLKAQ